NCSRTSETLSPAALLEPTATASTWNPSPPATLPATSMDRAPKRSVEPGELRRAPMVPQTAPSTANASTTPAHNYANQTLESARHRVAINACDRHHGRRLHGRPRQRPERHIGNGDRSTQRPGATDAGRESAGGRLPDTETRRRRSDRRRQ